MIGRRHIGSVGSRRDRDFDGDANERDRKRVDADRRKMLEAALDRGLEDSFPGSDPVAVTQPPRSACDKEGT